MNPAPNSHECRHISSSVSVKKNCRCSHTHWEYSSEKNESNGETWAKTRIVAARSLHPGEASEPFFGISIPGKNVKTFALLLFRGRVQSLLDDPPFEKRQFSRKSPRSEHTFLDVARFSVQRRKYLAGKPILTVVPTSISALSYNSRRRMALWGRNWVILGRKGGRLPWQSGSSHRFVAPIIFDLGTKFGSLEEI